MIHSMTGYGKAIAEFSDKNVIIELKSLNSKQLDLNTRISYVYREKELEIRNIISEKLVRGKIDVIIYVDYKEGISEKTINKQLVVSYCKQIIEISKELGVSSDSALEIAMRMPDVLSTETATVLQEDEWNTIKQAIFEACENITVFRKQEGDALAKDLQQNIVAIETLLQSILPYENLRIERLKERIQASLEEIISVDKIDKNRFEQELIFYIEKFDINEEKVRLQQHCNFFVTTMKEPNAGKKLSFIAQEMGREINTLGSKSNDADMQKIVVEMKDYLERIKEQVLNIQ